MPELTRENKTLGRVPPQNIEAEQSVLGCLLLDQNSAIHVADILAPEDFYKDVHQLIYRAMLELFEKREPIDLLSLSNRLAEKKQLDLIGGRTYLAELSTAVPSASNVVNYARIVQKKA